MHIPSARQQAFSLIELVMVMAIMAILALIALPSYLDKIVRDQIKESMPIAEVAKRGVAAYYAANGDLPDDNEAAGVPPADKLVGNLVSSVTVRKGAVTILFGNNSNASIRGKKLTIRPAVVPDQPVVPIAWVCNDMPVPKNMKVHGHNATDIQRGYLPIDCRGPVKT